MRDEYTETLKD